MRSSNGVGIGLVVRRPVMLLNRAAGTRRKLRNAPLADDGRDSPRGDGTRDQHHKQQAYLSHAACLRCDSKNVLGCRLQFS